MSDLGTKLTDAIDTLVTNEDRLRELGFTAGEFGQWFASNCRVTLYAVMGEWEIDILLPNGSSVGGDIPFNKFGGRTKAEIEAAKT